MTKVVMASNGNLFAAVPLFEQYYCQWFMKEDGTVYWGTEVKPVAYIIQTEKFSMLCFVKNFEKYSDFQVLGEL